ncbi:MAG: methionine adenosyltransferase [Candidatus Aminicenantes bacterium RBG_16_66_30]
MSERHLFTSESVTEGHPDKIADQISDAILDAIIVKDPKCHVACETLVTTGLAFISAEISTDAYVEIPRVVRKTIQEIGYDDATYGFDYETCAVITSIDDQSADIAMGVNEGSNDKEQGAGDQGIMFGYATRETPELMPLPIALAHKICYSLSQLRKSRAVDYLRPDGKSQVTVEYEGLTPVRIDTVVLSTQHKDMNGSDFAKMKDELIEKAIMPQLPAALIDRKKPIKFYINPTGRFVSGGPKADTGLTGRKIIVDTYGGMAAHGGGAFSGKDPSKVDRSACYAARYVAKNIVAAGLADRCQLQLAYAIGVAKPVSIMVETFGTGKVDDYKLTELVRDNFDLTPKGIIEHLKLRRPVYRQTAAYGHFGRQEDTFTWERTDMVDALRKGA